MLLIKESLLSLPYFQNGRKYYNYFMTDLLNTFLTSSITKLYGRIQLNM